MSTKTRREYLAVLRERYQKALSKKTRSFILEEAVVMTGLHKKSVIRAMNRKVAIRTPDLPKLGRPRGYSDEAIRWLKQFYRDSEYICSTKLKAMLPLLIEQCGKDIEESVRYELLSISIASIDRYLGAYRKLERRRKNTGTRPGSRLFKRLIPLKNLSNIAPGCGTLEADTVAHCGGNMGGLFIWSLTITDEYSGWTENRGILGKSADRVLPNMITATESFPFPLNSINVDNGSEFLNDMVYGYFLQLSQKNSKAFPMTRSRSYHKNDNARAEQKNWTTVRQLFGYERFESEYLVPIMNRVYETQSLIQNFFIPQMKLKSKVRIEAKIRKKYHPAATPYERVLNDPSVRDDIKAGLKEKFKTLNYYHLKKRKEADLAYFLKILDGIKSNQGPKAA